MKDSFTKELIELSAQAATIEQLNIIIKARDIKIAELEQKLASVKTICYECDAQVWELSPRSRCVKCEHRRAIFNEKDSDSLREKLECKNQ